MRFPRVNQYPREVSVAGETYKVRFKKYLGKDTCGLCDASTKTISIKTGLEPKDRFATFLHELIHAIEFEHELPIKHKLVYGLEIAIVEFLVANM